mgnify:CR=1 FL=1
MKRTNIVLNEKTIAKAQKVTGIGTQREVVDFALRELIRRHEISRLMELQGKVDWDGDLTGMRSERKR